MNFLAIVFGPGENFFHLNFTYSWAVLYRLYESRYTNLFSRTISTSTKESYFLSLIIVNRLTRRSTGIHTVRKRAKKKLIQHSRKLRVYGSKKLLNSRIETLNLVYSGLITMVTYSILSNSPSFPTAFPLSRFNVRSFSRIDNVSRFKEPSWKLRVLKNFIFITIIRTKLAR